MTYVLVEPGAVAAILTRDHGETHRHRGELNQTGGYLDKAGICERNNHQ